MAIVVICDFSINKKSLSLFAVSSKTVAVNEKPSIS
jgi:hypothetical protein